MPRSSRSKSHRQSKHSSTELKEYSDSEEDVKVKDRNGKEDGSIRVSKDSASVEKRKFVSQSRDGNDLSGHGNGDVAEEYVVSKRRKQKVEGGGSDRWNGGEDERSDNLVADTDKKGESLKSKESKVSADSKSKTSRRHDSGSDKKEDNASLVEESKGGSRVDIKRKSEKDSGRKEYKEIKEKDSGLDKEKKIQDFKNKEVPRKQRSESVDITEEEEQQLPKREVIIQEELRNPELEKELEKRIRRRGDISSDKDKYQDDVRDSDDKRSFRSDRSKDARHKNSRRKDDYGDKYEEDGQRDYRHKEDKYLEDGDKDNRHRDAKYWEDGEKDIKHREDKYREDGENDIKHREDKYRKDNEKDIKHKEEKYREDSDKDNRHRDDKYCEEGGRDNRRRDAKYHTDGNRDKMRKDDKYRADGDKDDKHRDYEYREDLDRDNRHKEEKHREDVDRDNRHRDGKQRKDGQRDKRARDGDAKYREEEEHTTRGRASDNGIKRSSDGSNASDIHYRKSSYRDISPNHDDRVTRFKDDKGRKIANEDHSDIRSQSAKELLSDSDHRSVGGGKVDSVTDKGRSNLRSMDVEVILNHSRRRSFPSPSTQSARDNYRVSRPEDSKYRDYGYDERARHNVNSSRDFLGAGVTEKNLSSLSIEISIQKGDSQLGEVSAERRPRSDAHASPLQIMDKSPSSTSNDRRYLNRSDIRQTLDVEDSGQRSGGSRDHSGREGKGSRELRMETYPVDELSQADGDNFSVSSPFTRSSNFSGNSRSLLPPPPPFRAGVDSPSIFGPSDDDNRGRPNNRHRRIGDPNMGRGLGNAWNGVPNWPSPLANGFIPFQHGPPPVGFHPVMQQFPAPPMFGVRPTMEFSHTFPCHFPETDNFSSHGRPLGWRNPVGDSRPPVHGWDSNNAIFGEESHVYERGSETGRGDMWKGQNIGLSTDFTAVSEKEDLSRPATDDVLSVQSDQEAQKEQIQPDLQAESADIQSGDALDIITPEAHKLTPEESPNISEVSRKDAARPYNVYLSKLDISTDLAHPELYEKFTSLMNLDQNAFGDEDNYKIIYMEEVLEAKVSHRISSASLFAAVNDSIFQRAMSIYNKQREDVGAVSREKVSSSNLENVKVVPAIDHKKPASNDDELELASGFDGEEAKDEVSKLNQEDVHISSRFQELEACGLAPNQKLDEPHTTDILEISEEQASMLNKADIEVDPVSKQEVVKVIVDDKSTPPQNVVQSDPHLLGDLEDVNRSGCPINESRPVDTKCAPLLCSDASSEACEAMLPESIESGLVNLSRIHHSPESTH